MAKPLKVLLFSGHGHAWRWVLLIVFFFFALSFISPGNLRSLLGCVGGGVNPFTTGNPFLATKLLGFSTGRGSGALKGLNTASSCAERSALGSFHDRGGGGGFAFFFSEVSNDGEPLPNFFVFQPLPKFLCFNAVLGVQY